MKFKRLEIVHVSFLFGTDQIESGGGKSSLMCCEQVEGHVAALSFDNSWSSNQP